MFDTWLRTPAQKTWAAFFGIMMVLFAVLTVFSWGDGTLVANKAYSEAMFESEQMSTDNALTFSLDSRELCSVKVKADTLDQSWVWAKVTIVDEKGRPVHSFDFNLSYYSGVEGGESWSEGDRDDYELFVLDPGKYSVVMYGEDEPTKADATSKYRPRFSNGYSTVDREEIIKVEFYKNVWMTRYFLSLFIAFAVFFFGYVYHRSQKGPQEWPAESYGDPNENPY